MQNNPKIQWGEYRDSLGTTYEGPYYFGTHKYVLPKHPSENDKRLKILTTTEGGAYDAVNMYDRCILSTGLIQYCEARYFLTSKMLHYVIEEIGIDKVNNVLGPAMINSGSMLKKNAMLRWRFHWKNGREILTLSDQQKLFLGCSGKKDEWTITAKAHANIWIRAWIALWQLPEAQKVQREYIGPRMKWFLMETGRKELFENDSDNESYKGATRAAYLSYAGNLPAIAEKHLKIHINNTNNEKWSRPWCIELLRELAWGSNIKIYPHRYDKIRPWLENLWEIELPKTSKELKEWKQEFDYDLIEEIQPTHSQIPEEPPPIEKQPSVSMKIVLREKPMVSLPRNTKGPEGIFGWFLWFISNIIGIFRRKR